MTEDEAHARAEQIVRTYVGQRDDIYEPHRSTFTLSIYDRRLVDDITRALTEVSR